MRFDILNIERHDLVDWVVYNFYCVLTGDILIKFEVSSSLEKRINFLDHLIYFNEDELITVVEHIIENLNFTEIGFQNPYHKSTKRDGVLNSENISFNMIKSTFIQLKRIDKLKELGI